jgi:hypothetical protein
MLWLGELEEGDSLSILEIEAVTTSMACGSRM